MKSEERLDRAVEGVALLARELLDNATVTGEVPPSTILVVESDVLADLREAIAEWGAASNALLEDIKDIKF